MWDNPDPRKDKEIMPAKYFWTYICIYKLLERLKSERVKREKIKQGYNRFKCIK